MTDEFTNTIVLQQKSQSGVDADGRPVHEGPLEDQEIELLSKKRLKSLLSEDGSRRKDLEAIATTEEGVLGRRVHDDTFVIVDKEAVKAAVANPDENQVLEEAGVVLGETDDSGELSLVSTIVLNRMLGKDKQPNPEDEPIAEELANFKKSGFDPYNSS